MNNALKEYLAASFEMDGINKREALLYAEKKQVKERQKAAYEQMLLHTREGKTLDDLAKED